MPAVNNSSARFFRCTHRLGIFVWSTHVFVVPPASVLLRISVGIVASFRANGIISPAAAPVPLAARTICRAVLVYPTVPAHHHPAAVMLGLFSTVHLRDCYAFLEVLPEHLRRTTN
ncbi:MAG: hypothetical protein LBT46_08250 [Planctomycetaceae bacterium]|nr:hypothetical protein [Planctomycetaceae bacterium]